jgi:rubrerythrin
MTLEEALVTSLDFEKRVRDYYLRAAEKTDDPRGKDVFKALSDEEQGHVDYLQSRLEQWRTTGKISIPTLATTLPKASWLKEGKLKMNAVAFDRDYSNEVALLRDSAKLEDDISELYKKLVEELPADQAAMFRRFLEIEDGHTAIVEAEIDALQKDGFWFSLREFDLEAG